jgi:c(7)-type cytochrome triheme protein
MYFIGGKIPIRLAATAVFVVVAVLAAVSGTRPVAEIPVSAQIAPPGQDYSKFSHRSATHAGIACASCHRRADNGVSPTFPGHTACDSCHSSQFINPPIICNICHSSLNSGHPPMNAFPSRFKEPFNVKFDHAQHNQGAARPANGCAACHTSARRGAAMSIPAGINTHTTCYQCHTLWARSGLRDVSGCATCHSAAAYRPTPSTSVAFNVGFSHATHGPRQRLNCTDCHTLNAGRPQGLQASSPRPMEHTPQGSTSCATCHNGKRAFGELTDCKRCHTGATFSFRGR